jgi:TPR repeat protein
VVGHSFKATDQGVLYTPQERKDNGYMVAGTLGILSLIVTGFLIRANELGNLGASKTYYEVPEKKFDSWLLDFNRKQNQNYVRVSQNNYWKLLIPKNQIPTYEAEEKRRKDEIERQRLLAEQRKREQEEKVVYDRIMEGREVSLDSYFTLYKGGKYYSEIMAISKSYPEYRKALSGKLREAKNYLLNNDNKFRRDEIERKVANLESIEKYRFEREKAVAYMFGFNASIDAEKSFNILNDLTAKNDYLASIWVGLFRNLGLGTAYSSHTKDNIGSKLITTTFKDAISAEGGEALFIYALHNALLSTELEDRLSGVRAISTLANVQNNALANYMLGLISHNTQMDSDAIKYLEKARSLGVTKASTALGVVYGNKQFGEYNKNKAIAYYNEGAAGGDNDAHFKLAQLYLTTMQDANDLNMAIDLATKSADNGNTGAMIFLGKLYSETKNGIRKEPEKVLQYFNKAASMGDVEAIFGLGIMYLDGNVLDMKDEQKGLSYLIEASQQNHSKSMLLLAQLHDEGKRVQRNEIKARYWYNKAQQYGAGSGARNAETESPLSTIFRLGDFSPTYTVTVNAYTGREISRTQDLGSGLMGGIVSGIFSGWAERYANQQREINGAELVETIGNKKIYAATLTSVVNTPIFIKKGQKIHITSKGSVSLGFFAGSGNANGISGFEGYSITGSLPHGSVIWRTRDNGWLLGGRNSNWTCNYVNEEGQMIIAINDSDYSNNQGYFDIVIEVEEQ